MLTIEEQERAAYAAGDTHTAALLASLDDAQIKIEEQEEEYAELFNELKRTKEELSAAQ